MSYGERKGVRKQPGEYGGLDMAGFGLASAFGIAVATFFDLTQSDDASTLFVFNRWLSQVTELLGLGNIPLYGVVLILMGLGAASILYLQPVTMRGAFAQGFGVLAAITTLAPSDLGNSMPAPTEAGEFIEELAPGEDPFGEEAELEAEPADISSPATIAPVYRVPVSTSAAMTTAAMMMVQEDGYSLRIKVIFPEGLEEDLSRMIRTGKLRGRLHNETTGLTYNLFRNTGADLNYRGGTIYIASRIPGEEATTSLVARIEADGYRIMESRFEASQGANQVWTVTMQPSTTPLFLQRLRKPYWF